MKLDIILSTFLSSLSTFSNSIVSIKLFKVEKIDINNSFFQLYIFCNNS